MKFNTASRRTPHGVRGLKLEVDELYYNNDESHPSRGAWIEILVLLNHIIKILVAPLTGCVD